MSEYNFETVHIEDHEAGTSREVKVLDLLDPTQPRASSEQRAERLSLCRECPSLKLKAVCNECGCFMPAKTWLAHASCPLGKW